MLCIVSEKARYSNLGYQALVGFILTPPSCPTLFTCYQQARRLMCVDLAKAQGGVEQQTGGGLRWLAVVARWTKHRLPLPANTGRPPLAYTVLSCLRQCTRCTGYILYWTYILPLAVSYIPTILKILTIFYTTTVS